MKQAHHQAPIDRSTIFEVPLQKLQTHGQAQKRPFTISRAVNNTTTRSSSTYQTPMRIQTQRFHLHRFRPAISPIITMTTWATTTDSTWITTAVNNSHINRWTDQRKFCRHRQSIGKISISPKSMVSEILTFLNFNTWESFVSNELSWWRSIKIKMSLLSNKR